MWLFPERVPGFIPDRPVCTERRRFVLSSEMKPPRPTAHHYILFYKPYGVLSQFTGGGNRRTLQEFGPFPGDVYTAGRLDGDSEGLLFLTNDKAIIHRLLSPEFRHPRTYLVQVERVPTEEALKKLREGILIEGKKTKPAEARLLHHTPALPPRPVPIRFRKTVSTAWLEITIFEGRNRQVRKMTGGVGYPTLRLIRTKIGFLSIQGLWPGESRELTGRELARLKKSLQPFVGSGGQRRFIHHQEEP